MDEGTEEIIHIVKLQEQNRSVLGQESGINTPSTTDRQAYEQCFGDTMEVKMLRREGGGWFG